VRSTAAIVAFKKQVFGVAAMILFVQRGFTRRRSLDVKGKGIQSVQADGGQAIFLCLSLVLFFTSSVFAQQSNGTLRGVVTDTFGGLIVGATVTLVDAKGVEKIASADGSGVYNFTQLTPGHYMLRATAPGFAPYENAAVGVAAGTNPAIDIVLNATVEQETVTVTLEAPISTEPENNAGAVVLRGADLETLPDDPEDLADALQALAGPSAGPDGGQTFIDGFSGGRLPPKGSIREIRINHNPFSAEYDRLGFGRVEIFTKPGSDKMRGQGFVSFNDESLNARDPFAPRRAAFQVRRYGANLSGPLVARKASFFLDFERRETDGNAVIRASILDSAFNIIPLNQIVLSPSRNTTYSPRLDYQLNATNTLVARYTYERNKRLNAGIGDLSLLSRAYDSAMTQQTVQMTETTVIKQKIVNETRFQYSRERRRQQGQNAAPTIRVLDAFIGGGSQISLSFNNNDHIELQNITSWAMGPHSLKAGTRLRHISLTDSSPQNFAGTFTFGGGSAPQLDANNQIVLDSIGQPVLISITSIERYRRTLLLQRLGLAPAEVRARGGGATQFSISGGNPVAQVRQTDTSVFGQDDWRARPNLTVSLGLRYEAQNNIHDLTDFAPRVAFAWGPHVGRRNLQQQQHMVLRGGFGIFYQRFNENLTLQANRFNGVNQLQFVVNTSTDTGRTLLDLFPNAPTIETLSTFSIPQTIRRVATDLQAPYTMQSSLSIERQLPHHITFAANFSNARTLHLLRSRNLGAPLPGTTGVRGNRIYIYESSGRLNQNQLVLSLNSRFNRRSILFATYTLNKANSDTDGAGSFPVNQFDLSGEYGRSAIDTRHNFFLGGTIAGLWRLRFNPFVSANSGRPFNITTGRDTNLDMLFTDRPAFATDLSRAGVIITRFGAFDPNPLPDQLIIPRNFGQGPRFFSVNLRVSRTFGFGAMESRNATAVNTQTRGGRPSAGGNRVANVPENRYSLTFSVNAINLFNHTNLGQFIGNLSSPLFGQPINTAGGFGGFAEGRAAGSRRIELQMRFAF